MDNLDIDVESVEHHDVFQDDGVFKDDPTEPRTPTYNMGSKVSRGKGYFWNSSVQCSFGRMCMLMSVFVIIIIIAVSTGKKLATSNEGGGLQYSGTSEKGGGVHYSGYVWNELPNGVQESAKSLGYTQLSWDKTKVRPSTFSFTWGELSDTEKGHAKTLGYNESNWPSKAKPSEATFAPTDGETVPESDGDTEEDSEEDTIERSVGDTPLDTIADTDEDTVKDSDSGSDN